MWNDLKPTEEMLVVLMEECGEVIKTASKIIRFGEDAKNVEELNRELGDLQCMIDLLHEMDLVSYTAIDEASAEKREKLKKWTEFAKLWDDEQQ